MKIGPTIRVYTIGFGMALIATLVVTFILSLVGAVIDEFAMGDFTSGCYVAMATFVVGGSAAAMMWAGWAMFAQYAYKQIGMKLPGYNDNL
ncbi:MAG: hypothetical protein IPG56_16135 [Caulobacteraceae bacterium]|nr:hypothetical protein [Caulobacteraceae bacterium]